MKLGSILYLPPPADAQSKYGDPQACLENLNRFIAKYPIVYFSDHGWPDAKEGYRIKTSPTEIRKRPTAKDNRFATANHIFCLALFLAMRDQYTHLIYLEADIRVGCDKWDDAIFQEHFELEKKSKVRLDTSGTLVAYNVFNWSLEFGRRYTALAKKCASRQVPLATYGSAGQDMKAQPAVFPNGALSVLNIEAMRELFEGVNLTDLDIAAKMRPFDYEIGVRMFEKYGDRFLDHTAMLNCIYSGYGNVLTTEEQRLGWLTDETFVAVHQVKSNAQPK